MGAQLPTDPAVPFAADGEGETGRVGVVLSHGFTGMPGSMTGWAGALADAGYTVRVPLLPGHGTRWQDLNKTTFDDWVGEITRTLAALSRQCDQVMLAGQSMGGTVALRAAQLFSDQVAGLMLVNPSVMSKRPELLVLPILKHVLPSLAAIGGDIRKEGVVEPAYDRTPLRALDSLRSGWGVVRRDLARISMPVLLMHSRTDNIVEPENSAIILSGISSTDTTEVWLEDSQHVATLDNDAELIHQTSVDFLRRVTGR